MRMKFLPVFGAIALLAFSIFTSCTSYTKDTDTLASAPELDTAKVRGIIAFRDSLMAKALERQKNHELNPTIFEGNDLFNYLSWEDGSVLLNGQFKSDSIERRYLFFLKDGKLLNTHERILVKQPVRIAKEAYYYYDGSHLFYAEERSSLLKEEEMPSVLKLIPFTAVNTPQAELEKALAPWWEKTLEATAEKAGLTTEEQ